MTYIFDIDGTIADASHRLHHIEGDIKNWDAFFSECDKDRKIDNIVNVLNTLTLHQYPVYFITGRNESIRDKTEFWIRQNTLVRHPIIYMRKDNDHRQDIEVKPELMQQLIKDYQAIKEQVVIFEDRTSVVKKWRELGFTCLQVCDGDY